MDLAFKEQPSPWVPFEDRRRARNEKRDAVLRMAVRMFLENGYHRTSLSDVAAKLNITKPALYNYFRSKEDILAECYRMGGRLYEERLALSVDDHANGLARLQGLIRAYALVIATDFGRCVVRLDVRELQEGARDAVTESKRRIDQTFRDTIALGIADGSIRHCDVVLTSFAITGALNGIGSWFDPSGHKSAEEVAETFAQQLTTGLAPADSPSPS